MRKRVYISGPLTTGGDPQANLAAAIKAWFQLHRLGYSPLCPHLTLYIDPHEQINHDDWMAIDLPWVEASDAVLRIAGRSKGADIEVTHAQRVGVPVFHSVEELSLHFREVK